MFVSFFCKKIKHAILVLLHCETSGALGSCYRHFVITLSLFVKSMCVCILECVFFFLDVVMQDDQPMLLNLNSECGVDLRYKAFIGKGQKAYQLYYKRIHCCFLGGLAAKRDEY